jgi:hypothetical protein
MPEAATSVSLKSKVLGTYPVSWKDLQFIQQEEFKELPQEARAKLKASILTNQFTEPFKVWKDPESEIIYCLDGKHRSIILHELMSEGSDIPDQLPGTFIDCADKTEAAKLVLVFSSIYARITETGLIDFQKMYSLDMEELSGIIDLPYVKTDLEIGVDQSPFDDQGIGVKNQYGVIVMCKDEADQEDVFKQLSEKGYECKIVVT